VNLSHSLLLDNRATGGPGGAAGDGGASGGNGGNAQGGGLFNRFGVTVTVADTVFLGNRVQGGRGAASGTGGNGQGGGIFNDAPASSGTPDLTILRSVIVFNQADAGAGGGGWHRRPGPGRRPLHLRRIDRAGRPGQRHPPQPRLEQ
jgi:hypothetical protein